MTNWTFGAEHEFADWPRARPLPKGITLDQNERTMGNSCGSAVDGKGVYTQHGGEFLTAPSDIDGQIEQFIEIIETYPEARPNNRSGLHIHIWVPGLREDLDALQRIQRYVHSAPGWLQRLDPIAAPDFTGPKQIGALRRYRRLKASHHSMVTPWRVHMQMQATTPEQFFEAEVEAEDGRLIWNLIRSAVNLRHLRQTDTIEFRHWFATLDPYQVRRCMVFCRDFLENALRDDKPLDQLVDEFLSLGPAPACEPYIHWQDQRFWASTLDGSIPKLEAIGALQLIKDGDFHSGPRIPGEQLREMTTADLVALDV